MTPAGAIALVAAVLAAGAAVIGVHPAPAHPARTPAEIRLAALSGVARRLYTREARGTAVRAAVHRITADPRILAAVRARDPRALRAAALRELFAPGHVVRIAVRAGGLSVDVGGRFVVAPWERRSRVAGRTVTVDASIQDVAGFGKLVRREVGLDAVVADHHGHRWSSLGGRPVRLPLSGAAVVDGRARLVRSFVVRGWHGEQLTVRVLGRAA